MNELSNQIVFITGAAHRLGKVMALASAKAGADIILHHGHSVQQAEETADEIRSLGRKCWVLQADFNDPNQVTNLISNVASLSPIYCLVNSASVFSPGNMLETTLPVWQKNIDINLTVPFLLSQSFIRDHQPGHPGRIINIVDWRALRPGRDHFAYTISKAAVVALTQATAIAGAPDISVNALALGAILPPANEPKNEKLIDQIPFRRWADLSEFEDMFTFLLTGPSYLNGEVIHLDGGRHIV